MKINGSAASSPLPPTLVSSGEAWKDASDIFLSDVEIDLVDVAPTPVSVADDIGSDSIASQDDDELGEFFSDAVDWLW